MLVLTIQDKSVLREVEVGSYKCDFWKSEFCCLSPTFTKGYMKLASDLTEKTGKVCEVPVFGWIGVPFLDLMKGKSNKKALFLDVPSEYLNFSDYDRFCDYAHGSSESSDFILSEEEATRYVNEGRCVQVCLPYIKKEWLLTSVDLSLLEGCKGTIEECYRYCNILKAYCALARKIVEEK